VEVTDWTQGLVFANTTGGLLYGRYVTNKMKRLMSDVGLEPRRFHDLRHTAATLMLVMGAPLETLRQASFRTTKGICGHILPSMQREAADRMGARPEAVATPVATHGVERANRGDGKGRI
jgi:integrase